MCVSLLRCSAKTAICYRSRRSVAATTQMCARRAHRYLIDVRRWGAIVLLPAGEPLTVIYTINKRPLFNNANDPWLVQRVGITGPQLRPSEKLIECQIELDVVFVRNGGFETLHFNI